jgi:hypothetical protein
MHTYGQQRKQSTTSIALARNIRFAFTIKRKGTIRFKLVRFTRLPNIAITVETPKDINFIKVKLLRVMRTAKGGFYHDGRFTTLLDVVNHYNACKKLNLSDIEKKDLVEYLKSL